MLDHWPGTVSSRLHDVNLLLDYHASVCGIVRRDHSGEEGEVNAEGIFGHDSASADLLAEVFGCGLRERSQLQSS